jgi:hypothetical protein
MSLEHSPARDKRPSGTGLNLIKGARNIAAYLGNQFTARQVHYLHETRRLPIFQLGGSGPLYASPNRLDEAIRELERQSTEAA